MAGADGDMVKETAPEKPKIRPEVRMRFRNVCIEGIGYHLPETVLSTEEIEKQLGVGGGADAKKNGTKLGFLELLTGIRERRIWKPGTRPSQVASASARKALQNARVDPAEVDLVIHTGVCRDALEPATATMIHGELGLSPRCMPFDLSNACLGFLNGLWVSAHMIEAGSVKTALVVSGENAGPIYHDTIETLRQHPEDEGLLRRNLASLTLGSASVAYVLRHQDTSFARHFLVGGAAETDSSSRELCRGEGDLYHQRMETNTAELMKKGLALSQICWESFKTALGWSRDTPDHIFNHQVSRSHQQKVFELLELDPAKGCEDFDWLGNTGTVAAPLSLALRAEKKGLRKGDALAILGIGSGLNSMMLGVVW